MGSNFLDGCVAKRKHFYFRCACINNDFKEYWKEYFCSLVNYFKFWKSYPWHEIQEYNFVSSNAKYTVNGDKMERKSLKKYLSKNKWHLQGNGTLFQGLFFFVGPVLVQVGIRTDETGFLETFQVPYLCQSLVEEITFFNRKLWHCKYFIEVLVFFW